MTPISVTITMRVEIPTPAPDAVRAAVRALALTAKQEGFPVRGRDEDVFHGAHVEIDRRGPTLPTEVPSIAAALAHLYAVAGSEP